MWHYFLLLYLIVYFAAAFVWRSYLVWKRTGVNPYVLGTTDDAHGFIGRLFRLTVLATVLVVLIYTFLPRWYEYLTPILWLEHPFVTGVGVVLLLLSLIWIVIAQAQMGNAWRIGVDQNTATDLVDHGLFAVSRNPIFLGMRINLLGLFLVLPTAATLAIWLVGDVLMQIQVRLEEAHLISLHGDRYRTYQQKTRRWFTWGRAATVPT
jgi:protein-S-isoprenylcysteine O-methyltransferase Ste14